MSTGNGFQPLPEDTIYLSSVSPRDKVWEKHRANADAIKNLYRGTIYDCYANRISACSGLLGFKAVIDEETGEIRFKLSSCRFCRVRQCTMCQWRRQLTWRGRFFCAFPKILKDHPKSRFLFLTLTVRNCALTELRETLIWMNKSWERLTKRSQFPALGWVKSVEVTRSIIGEAHPHFHAILMVNESYFKRGYLSKEKWIQLWRDCLRVDYNPSIDITVVKSATSVSGDLDTGLMKSLCETLKYSVKPEDLIFDKDWLVELTTQLHKTRSVAVGGLFKSYISEEEAKEEIGIDGQGDEGSLVWFGWKEMLEHYSKIDFFN